MASSGGFNPNSEVEPGRPRSAGLQPAVAPVFNRQNGSRGGASPTGCRFRRFKTCDTAGCKPALRGGRVRATSECGFNPAWRGRGTPTAPLRLRRHLPDRAINIPRQWSFPSFQRAEYPCCRHSDAGFRMAVQCFRMAVQSFRIVVQSFGMVIHSFRMVVLCFRMAVLCFRMAVLCFRMAVLCFRIAVLCFRMAVLCFRIAVLCFRIAVLCFRIAVLCFRMAVLCFRMSVLCLRMA